MPTVVATHWTAVRAYRLLPHTVRGPSLPQLMTRGPHVNLSALPCACDGGARWRRRWRWRGQSGPLGRRRRRLLRGGGRRCTVTAWHSHDLWTSPRLSGGADPASVGPGARGRGSVEGRAETVYGTRAVVMCRTIWLTHVTPRDGETRAITAYGAAAGERSGERGGRCGEEGENSRISGARTSLRRIRLHLIRESVPTRIVIVCSA